jgi:hypothetical protein
MLGLPVRRLSREEEKTMATTTPTKAELQQTLDEIGEKVTEMLNPALTREQVIELAQELDELVNGSDEDDETEEEEDDEEEEE